jgi:hypothetical protein
MPTYLTFARKMTPTKILALYVVISAGILAIARPYYDAVSGYIILIGGATGSLKLFVDSSRDIFYEDLLIGRQFSSEALTVALFALAIWLLGALMVFMAAKSKWKGGYLLGTLLIWLVGSGYNLLWFGIRSL